jgi:hypothetical protein
MSNIRTHPLYHRAARKYPTLANREARLAELDRELKAAQDHVPQDVAKIRRLAIRRKTMLTLIMDERQPGLL